MHLNKYASMALSVVSLLAFGCSAEQAPEQTGLIGETEQAVGNGSQSGSHFNLNIIGVPNDKNPNMTGNGGRIFVKLEGNSKIMLAPAPEGESFEVLDANGTDGEARFQLPRPNSTNPAYQIYARALGQPGGGSTMTTCAEDPSDESTICSMYKVELRRYTGKSSFTNVTKELTTLCVDMVVDTTTTVYCYDLFDDGLEDYFWNYDNQGLRVAQLRFYEI